MHMELSSDVTEKSLLGLTIPACPASLANIMREAKSPSADFTRLAQLITRDAGITGSLLKLVNSPFIGLREKVTSVFQAVSILGIQNTLNLVQNISLRQSIGGNSPSFDKFWEQSSLTATIAEKIAVKFPSVSKNDAYLVALFHDCGIPVLMMKFPEYRDTLITQGKLGKAICDIENEYFSTSHTVVGNMLTRSWMLPSHISKAILYHHDTTIFSSQPSEDTEASVRNLIAIVLMAEAIADEHLLVRDKKWPEVEDLVLRHFEISAQEFSELQDDILAFLNGE